MTQHAVDYLLIITDNGGFISTPCRPLSPSPSGLMFWWKHTYFVRGRGVIHGREQALGLYTWDMNGFVQCNWSSSWFQLSQHLLFFKKILWSNIICVTSMHFSSMRTVRSSSRLLGGVCPGGCLPGGVYPSMHWSRNPSRGQNSWHTLLKILPCRNFVAHDNK